MRGGLALGSIAVMAAIGAGCSQSASPPSSSSNPQRIVSAPSARLTPTNEGTIPLAIRDESVGQLRTRYEADYAAWKAATASFNKVYPTCASDPKKLCPSQWQAMNRTQVHVVTDAGALLKKGVQPETIPSIPSG